MQGILPLKEIAQISKAKLTLAVGLAENYKIINEEYIEKKPSTIEAFSQETSSFDEALDEKLSPSASLYDTPTLSECSLEEAVKKVRFALPLNTVPSSKARVDEYTSYEDRENLNPVKTKVLYINEYHSLKITEKVETKRLSRYQLMQYILYHFYNVDSNGIVKNIHVKDVARVLGCSVNTVNNNNDVLAELGFIALSKIDASIFNLIILGYRDNRKTRDQKGTGYVQMPKNMLLDMLKVKHVNSLRLAIRQYIKCDNNEGVKNTPEAEYSFSEFKFFLPKNLGFTTRISKALKENSKFFEQRISADGVVFKLREEYNGKKQRQLKEETYREELSRYLVEKDSPALINDLKDLTQLAMEYGLGYLKKAINNLMENPEISEIESLGAYLRQQIRKDVQKSLSEGYKKYQRKEQDKIEVA